MFNCPITFLAFTTNNITTKLTNYKQDTIHLDIVNWHQSQYPSTSRQTGQSVSTDWILFNTTDR